MKLFELFDHAVPYKLRKTKFGFEGTFTIGEQGYVFLASEAMPETAEALRYMEWEMGTTLNPHADYEAFERAVEEFPSYEISFRLSGQQINYDMSGTGEQYKVFTTVMNMISDVVRKKAPVEIHFDSKEASRTKLYDRMVQKIASTFGYKDSSESANAEGSKDYVLVRNGLGVK